MKHNEKNIDQYLQLQHPRLIKQYLWGWLIMINLFGIPTSIYGVLNNYTKVFLLPVIIIDIWAIYLMIEVGKKQKAYILFVGVFCTIMSLLLMVASFKIIQPVNGFPLDEYMKMSVLTYIAILVLGGIYHKLALMRGYYFNKNAKSKKGVGIIIFFSALGLLVGRVIVRNVTEQIGTIIFAICVLILGYLLELGIHNIYKYYLIKKYNKVRYI